MQSAWRCCALRSRRPVRESRIPQRAAVRHTGVVSRQGGHIDRGIPWHLRCCDSDRCLPVHCTNGSMWLEPPASNPPAAARSRLRWRSPRRSCVSYRPRARRPGSASPSAASAPAPGRCDPSRTVSPTRPRQRGLCALPGFCPDPRPNVAPWADVGGPTATRATPHSPPWKRSRAQGDFRFDANDQ
jgi:hypothetical protein